MRPSLPQIGAIIDLIDAKATNSKITAKPRTLASLIKNGWAKIVEGRHEATPSGVAAMYAESMRQYTNWYYGN